ncbi:hypothetical protein VNI00_017735 [Paramarasmius palmivorus]|uniref:Uncharacterized protein n=1 Tax=Paramarasmius palmivorus TaxID=297713 RepID=A0AAW0B3G9_9AGAR
MRSRQGQASNEKWYIPSQRNTWKLEEENSLPSDMKDLLHSPLSLYNLMSESKKKDLQLLGAIIRLSLLYGYPVDPINPLFLIYLLHNNSASLMKSLVSTWFPELFKILSTWISLSATDAIPQDVATHLINYHETMASAFTGRSEEMHKQFGWQMLQHVVIGPKPISHLYFQAFLEGFMLPCVEGKMNLGRGGPEAFVGSVYACNISGYSSLRLTFTKLMKEETQARLSQAMLSHPFYQSMRTVEDVIRDFLDGRGIPCPHLLSSVANRFNKGVNLEDAASEGPPGATFCCRMFCWAATGVPFVLLDEPKIEVRLVDETDESYSRESEGHRISFMQQGVCRFRTCPRLFLLPAPYLIKLLEANYGSKEELEELEELEQREEKDARVAIHHWLLSTILDNAQEKEFCPLARLHRFEQGVVKFLAPGLFNYFEKLHHEFLAWIPGCSLSDAPDNPLQYPYTVFSSMGEAVHRIFECILEEHGALGQECKDVQQVQEIVNGLIRCVDDLQMASFEEELEERGRKGTLAYQTTPYRELFNGLGQHRVL